MTFDTDTRRDADATTVDAAAYPVAPVNERSRARLAEHGLEYRLVPVAGDDYPQWLQSAARGFQDGERSDEQVASSRERSAYRRVTGVYDSAAPVADAPVGTIASWIGQLTVPGGSALPSCAISAVTVAPTHRRRGIARAMLEGELGVAVSAGAPLAMLTVSESTLYGRYGFASAAASASWRIETKRATWIGPRPDGRVDFIPRQRFRELVAPLHERVRLRVAGEIDVQGGFWDGFAGTTPTAEKAGEKRAVQYTDASGEVRGVAVYTVKENHDDFTKASVHVGYLLAETDDAYAALWRFLLELDLVGEVNAGELSVDEPLRWMIADQRAATVTLRDHQYVRILDVPAALEARRYGAPGSLALDVTDVLGLAGGRFLVMVDDDGRGTVSTWPDGAAAPDGVVEVSLGIEELSAAYLGGVSLVTLAAAGRVRSTDAAAAARVFSWHVAPRLSIWY
ncbi:GNAT family N-acetyltransferase [Microbacterium sp. CFH 31415]|uniref:GNAT family N-acetyltransferase n=1 Tax=Microbacterium sp. CFH 31415 TaxID=2921732 RepID=UPI001F145CDC|nr:GNAT family N-acetyltransferase [Microbacterium sp. CFH 31415]MCH6230287.1 GNAT family N-acetyltransferase [Microbacterium sp. CFH 31415]